MTSRRRFKKCFLAGCLSIATVAASGQAVVHALSGTVTSVDSKSMSMTVTTDDGATRIFKLLGQSKIKLQFDQKLREGTTPATEFSKQGTHLIVFYIVGKSVRREVAFIDLGTGPFERTTGVVVHFDRHEGKLSIKDKSGSVKSFKITDKTVAETGMGAIEGKGFDANEGDRIRVTSTGADETKTALLINAV